MVASRLICVTFFLEPTGYNFLDTTISNLLDPTRPQMFGRVWYNIYKYPTKLFEGMFEGHLPNKYQTKCICQTKASPTQFCYDQSRYQCLSNKYVACVKYTSNNYNYSLNKTVLNNKHISNDGGNIL